MFHDIYRLNATWKLLLGVTKSRVSCNAVYNIRPTFKLFYCCLSKSEKGWYPLLILHTFFILLFRFKPHAATAGQNSVVHTQNSNSSLCDDDTQLVGRLIIENTYWFKPLTPQFEVQIYFSHNQLSNIRINKTELFVYEKWK